MSGNAVVEHAAPDAAGVTQTAAVADVAAHTRPAWQSDVPWHAPPEATGSMHVPQPVASLSWQTLLAHSPPEPHTAPVPSLPGDVGVHAFGGLFSKKSAQLTEPYATEHFSVKSGVSAVSLMVTAWVHAVSLADAHVVWSP